VVYVGQSINVIGRVLGHMTEGKKQFDSYSFIECDREDLNWLEARHIAAFSAEYNETIPSGHGFLSATQWARHFGIPSPIFTRLAIDSGVLKKQRWYRQDDLKDFMDFMEYGFGDGWMNSRRRPTIGEIQMKVSCFRGRTQEVGCF